MIETLQSGSREAVKAMDVANKRAEESVEYVGGTAESLSGITSSIETIEEMSTQISAAAEEQIAVVEELERNTVNISQASEQAAEGAKLTADASEVLSDLAKNLQAVVNQVR